MSDNLLFPVFSDEAGAARACRIAGDAALVVAGLAALLSAHATAGLEPALAPDFGPWGFVDAVLTAGLGLGVRKGSRVAAIALLVFYVGSIVVAALSAAGKGATPAGVLVAQVGVAVLFFRGVRGALALARLRAEGASPPTS